MNHLKNSIERGVAKQHWNVCFASRTEIEGIMSVQTSNLLSQKKEAGKKDLGQKGFLIHRASNEELEELISEEKNHIVLVAKEKDRVTGYVLAYDLTDWRRKKPEWDSTIVAPEQIKELLGRGKTLYFRHIARLSECKGTGSVLLARLLQIAESRSYDRIIAEVLLKPIQNLASTRFVERFGFRAVGNVIDKDPLIWNLYMKEMGGEL